MATVTETETKDEVVVQEQKVLSPEEMEKVTIVDTSYGIEPVGDFRVNLGQCVTDHFYNYRKTVSEGHITNLMRSFGMNKKGEQLHNLNGTWIVRDGKPHVAIFSGSCRIEAMRRNALKKVVEDYNESIGAKEPTDEGFISLGGKGFESHFDRLKIRDASEEWKKRYDEALEAYEVNVKTQICKSNEEAQLLNIEVNRLVEKPSLWDDLREIDRLVKMGISNGRIARAIGQSAPAISQHKKIWLMIPALRKKFGEDFQGETAAEAEAVIAELVNRMGLKDTEDKCAKFSLVRELSEKICDKTGGWKGDLKAEPTLKLLKDTVAWDANKPSNRPTVQLPVFRARLKDAIAESADKKPEPEAKPEGEAAAASAGKTDEQAVDAAAQKQETADTSAAEEAAIDADNAAAVEEGTAAAAPTAEEVAKVGDEAETEADLSELEKVDDSELMAELTGGDTTEAGEPEAEGEAKAEPKAEGEPAAEKPVDGAMKTGVVDAEVATKYKMLAESSIEQRAVECVEIANDSESNIVEKLASLYEARAYYEVLGLAKHSLEINKVASQLVESVHAYIEELRNVVRTKATDKDKAKLKAVKPKYVEPDLRADDLK